VWAILVILVLLLSSLRGTLWVPHRQAPPQVIIKLFAHMSHGKKYS
jgi:hypothetical protein